MIRQELLSRVPEPQRDKQPNLRTRTAHAIRKSVHNTRRTMSHTGSLAREYIAENKITTIGIPILAVAALGAAEGGMYSDWNPRYMLAYGIGRLTAAPIWVRDTSEAVAAVVGVPPNQLHDFAAEAAAAKPDTAAHLWTEQFIADKFYQVSSIIGGATIFLNVSNFAFKLSEARRDLRADIKDGKEPIWKQGEQVFFVGGKHSNILNARIDRDPLNTVPIMEGNKGAETFIAAASNSESRSVYINVGDKNYGASHIWEKIKFKKEWLIDVQGRKKLLLVGDGSAHEESLDLHDDPTIDVTIKDLQITTDKLRERAHAAQIQLLDEDVVSIYLSNGERSITTGGGNSIKMRAHAEKYASVDIFVDSRAPLIERIIAWLNGSTDMVFDTTNVEYFNTLSTLLNKHGINVLDQCDEIPDGIPYLVYEEVTAETVRRAQEINSANITKKNKILAITDTLDGHTYAQEQGVEDMCTAKVYDAELEFILDLIKMGNSPKAIQNWLDFRWEFSTTDTGEAPKIIFSDRTVSS